MPQAPQFDFLDLLDARVLEDVQAPVGEGDHACQDDAQQRHEHPGVS